MKATKIIATSDSPNQKQSQQTIPKGSGNSNSSTNQQVFELLQQSELLLRENKAEAALKGLTSNLKSHELTNARCVCLMRMGKFADALELYRNFMLEHNCPCIKPGMQIHHKSNFALCLLLNNNPSGCQSTIQEISRKEYPGVKRILSAFSKWEKTLTLMQWFNWKVGGVSPLGTSIPYSDTLGTLFDESKAIIA